jgi:hypothetical protein
LKLPSRMRRHLRSPLMILPSGTEKSHGHKREEEEDQRLFAYISEY